MLFASFVALAFGGSALPADVANLEKSVQAYRQSVQELDTSTANTIAYAAKVHQVAANATERKALQKRLMDELNAKLPEAAGSSRAQEEVEKAAVEFQKAESERAAALHALRAAKAWAGENATAAETAKHEALERAAAQASDAADAARHQLDARVKEANERSEALRRAEVEQADKIERDAQTLVHAAREHESAAKKAMRGAVNEGEEQSARLMRHGNVSERVGERMENSAEFWAEGHEHAIEKAGDAASDDLERIYGPVLEAAGRAKSQAEDAARSRADKNRDISRRADRLELLDVPESKQFSAQTMGAGYWMSGILAVRRRSAAPLPEPRLGARKLRRVALLGP